MTSLVGYLIVEATFVTEAAPINEVPLYVNHEKWLM